MQASARLCAPAEDMNDEQVYFLSDILQTGYCAAENGDIKPVTRLPFLGCRPVTRVFVGDFANGVHLMEETREVSATKPCVNPRRSDFLRSVPVLCEKNRILSGEI